MECLKSIVMMETHDKHDQELITKASFDERCCHVRGGDDGHDSVTPRPWPTSSAASKVARAKIRTLCASRERRGEDNLKFFKNNVAKNGTCSVSGKNTAAASCYYYTINEPWPSRYTHHIVQG